MKRLGVALASGIGGVLTLLSNYDALKEKGPRRVSPLAVKAKPDETVIFSWIVWPSKEARDSAWAKMMEDPRMTAEGNPMPYDGKRLIYGGFQPILER